jgi:tetratricopeptide (TPR) repeat protein
MTAFTLEEQSKRKRQQLQQAQQLAANGEWTEAVELNREILKAAPNDVQALNRLGKALSELGRYGEAHASYAKSVELDPANQIARRNLQRLEPLKDSEGDAQAAERRRTQARQSMFIEEIGKTRVTELAKRADDATLARMTSGDQVELRTEGKYVVVFSEDGLRLGQLDTRLSQRLITLMKGGNRYGAAVTAVEPGLLRVIVRETYQHPSQAGRLSFPADTNKPLAPRAYTRATERLYATDDQDFLTDDDDVEDVEETESEDEEEFPDGDDALTADEPEEEEQTD